MRTLYLECNAGVSGDMLLGALSDLLKDPFELKGMIEGLGIPGIVCNVSIDEKSKISGIRVSISCGGVEEGDVENEKKHQHHMVGDVFKLIASLNVSDRVKSDAAAIYAIIAEAESNVHGKPVNEVHFHEVGALDAIADVVGVCMLIERLAPATIIASPLRTGYGEVVCAHGTLPVPAPATAYILQGMPIYAGDAEGEFTTPTGAAIVKHFAESFGQLPLMEFEDMGYGLGKKDMGIANMVRAFIGEVDGDLPVVKELSCNIDDMSPEDMGSVIDILMEAGALDAFITGCIMKKSRPGYLLTCICREEDEEDLAMTILAHTSTIGVRTHVCERYEMHSRFESYRTEFGDVRIKVSEGFGYRKWKPEYEDLLRNAIDYDVPVSDIRNAVHYDPDEEDGDD